MSKTKLLIHSAAITALYVVLTLIAHSLGLANHAIQIRFSEALTILPAFTPAAIPGLFAGCILANFLTGCLPWDIAFGSAATLLGAVGTWILCHPKGLFASHLSPNARKWAAPAPPIFFNTVIVPFILAYVYQFPGSLPYFFVTVAAGEIISCGLLGSLLYKALIPHQELLFR